MFTRDTICEYTLALCTQCTQPLLKNATKPYFTWVAGVYISGLSDVHRMYTHVHTLMCFGHKTARKSGNLRVYVLWNGFGFLKGHLPMLPAPAHASSACLLECGESTLPSISNAPINSKGTLLHAKVPFVC